MLTASCPKCAKQVTVPSSALPESRVRCPLCAEEYTLESVFADLPPLLVLLDEPAPIASTSGIHAGEPVMAAAAAGATGEGGSSSIFDFGAREEADAVADADTAIALADSEEASPEASAFAFGDAAPAAESVGTGPRTTTVRPKGKKKAASPVKSIIGVVVGGLVALPMAQMILWYLPGGWDVEKRDPMSIGRDYPTTFGLLAPSWVKSEGTAAGGAENATDNPTPVAVNNNVPEDDGVAEFPLPGGELPQPAVEEPPVVEEPDLGGETIPPIDDPAIDEPVVEEPAAPKSPVKDAPTFTTAQLGDELKIAKDAQGLIDNAVDPAGDGGEKRKAAESYLKTMSQLARVLTFTPDRQSGHLEFVSEMVGTGSDTVQKRTIISTLATLQLGKADRETDGTMFMGKVLEIQPRGELFETVVEAATKTKKPISVYTADDPQGSVAVGDEVTVLGVIVDEPNDNLAGYKGEPDPVVWGGYWQVLPVAE